MVALTKLPYWLCRNEVPDEQLGEVFLREVIQTTVAYGCRDMIVALAPYKSPELHVASARSWYFLNPAKSCRKQISSERWSRACS